MLWCLSITTTSHCLLKYLFADRSTSAVVMCACSYMRKSFWQKIHISIYMGLFLTLSFLKVLFKWVLVYYFLALQCLLLFYWFSNLLFWNVNLIYFLWGDPSCVLAYLGYALFWKIHLCTYVYSFAFLPHWPPVETSILFGCVKFSLLTTSVNIYSLSMQVACCQFRCSAACHCCSMLLAIFLYLLFYYWDKYFSGLFIKKFFLSL